MKSKAATAKSVKAAAFLDPIATVPVTAAQAVDIAQRRSIDANSSLLERSTFVHRVFEATIANLKREEQAHRAAAGQLALEALLAQHYDGELLQCSVNAEKESNALREAATSTGIFLALQEVQALKLDVFNALSSCPFRNA